MFEVAFFYFDVFWSWDVPRTAGPGMLERPKTRRFTREVEPGFPSERCWWEFSIEKRSERRLGTSRMNLTFIDIYDMIWLFMALCSMLKPHPTEKHSGLIMKHRKIGFTVVCEINQMEKTTEESRNGLWRPQYFWGRLLLKRCIWWRPHWAFLKCGCIPQKLVQDINEGYLVTCKATLAT